MRLKRPPGAPTPPKHLARMSQQFATSSKLGETMKCTFRRLRCGWHPIPGPASPWHAALIVIVLMIIIRCRVTPEYLTAIAGGTGWAAFARPRVILLRGKWA